MFSSDIELDFDDDFPFDTFCQKVTSQKGDAPEKGRVCDPVNNGKRGPSLPPSQPPKADSNPSTRTGSGGAFVFAPGASDKENSLKRPHVQDEKPQKKRLSHEGLLQRKFPGPAGLLPDKPFRLISDTPLPMDTSSPEEEPHSDKDKCLVYSQSSGSVFLQSAYQKLLSDFSLTDSANPLNKYTVDWLKRTALTKGLQGRKVPFLGLVIHALNHNMPDPVLVLRDPTGEITGSLHREVWAEMGPKLRTGIALALRQVGVLITGVIRRQIYLNITMNNILAVYSPSGGERGVEITTVNRVSQSELLRNSAPRRPPPPSLGVVGGSGGSSGQEGLKKKEGGEGGEEVLSEWGIVLGEGDFSEEMRVPEGGRVGCSEALSPAESMIFEEVLSGIDPDEFEM